MYSVHIYIAKQDPLIWEYKNKGYMKKARKKSIHIYKLYIYNMVHVSLTPLPGRVHMAGPKNDKIL